MRLPQYFSQLTSFARNEARIHREWAANEDPQQYEYEADAEAWEAVTRHLEAIEVAGELPDAAVPISADA